MKITGSFSQHMGLFGVFFAILAILLILTYSGRTQDLVLLDSVTVPVVETYDTTCQCYPDSLTVYSWLNSTAVDDTLALQFGYTRFGRNVWTTIILFADSLDTWSLNPIIMHHLDPYDVNRDGRVSIVDAALLIWRLFIR